MGWRMGDGDGPEHTGSLGVLLGEFVRVLWRALAEAGNTMRRGRP